MFRTPNLDPRLERRLRRDGVQPIISRESTVTPVKYPLTISQAWNQWLLSQEPVDEIVEDSAPEGMEHILDSHDQQQDHSRDNSQNLHPDTFGLDLQAILLALVRRPDTQPRKKNKGVKEPDLFSGGSPDELWAFIFQCQIYFHACEGEFLKDTKRIFFAISYLRGVALDYFEPFINEAKAYQNFDFLEDWSAFV